MSFVVTSNFIYKDDVGIKANGAYGECNIQVWFLSLSLIGIACIEY